MGDGTDPAVRIKKAFEAYAIPNPSMNGFAKMFPRRKPIIGVIHLPPLPGHAESPGLEGVMEKALVDLEALEKGGVDGVLVENTAGQPHWVEASSETIATMTRVARELREASRQATIGVEILLNDPIASLAVAHASGAQFIRTDYFVDPMERPEYGGAMKIDPEKLLSYRERIGAHDVLILADIQVKYARMLEERTLAQSARLAERHRADAIIVTGGVTGEPPGRAELAEAKSGAAGCPILVGSGLDEANALELLSVADGAIVGSSLKTGEWVDSTKVIRLKEAIRGL